MEDLEAMGLFWTPDSPSREHQGILTHVNGQGAILKLAGFSSEPILDVGPKPQKLVATEMGEVIHGNTTVGPITLLGWYQTHVGKWWRSDKVMGN